MYTVYRYDIQSKSLRIFQYLCLISIHCLCSNLHSPPCLKSNASIDNKPDNADLPIELQGRLTTTTWQAKASGKRDQIAHAIPSQWKIEPSQIPPPSALLDFGEWITTLLDPQEILVTSASAGKILVNVRSGQWTAVEVTSFLS